jgi:hypothetical protein
MQYGQWLGALLRSAAVGSSVFIGACAGGSASGNAEPGHQDEEDASADAHWEDEDADLPDAYDDADDAAAEGCSSDTCAAGQRCESSSTGEVCVGTCDEVACAAGLVCEVRENVGRCVVPCWPACGEGQRCELDGAAHCVDNGCDELDCGAEEACVPASTGSGFVCVDNRCDDDLGCAEDAHCSDAGVCTADACRPGARTCAAETVRECMPNGAGTIERVACSTGPHVVSECGDAADGAACSCRDDWDCPAFTECVQGRCAGSGRAPTCFLPPLPFASLLPRAESGFPWGGDDADGYNPDKTALNAGDPFSLTGAPSSRDATGHPFPHHAQVSATPIVANLTDDNGDGRIDELDAPEIVFTSFCDRNYFNHGVLRALHGGGPNAGEELFAVCEDKLWREGQPLVDDQGALLAAANCTCNQGDLEPTGALAVGDLDGDGIPEIAVAAHAASAPTSDVTTTRLVLFRNTGELISSNAIGNIPGNNPAVTFANLDGEGLSEIVVGPIVLLLGRDGDNKLVVAKVLTGAEAQGRGINNGQGPVSCAADLDGDGKLEVVAGGTAYELPAAPAGGCPAAPELGAEAEAYCAGRLLVRWHQNFDGFCAVADVLAALPVSGPEVAPGPTNPLDGKPEVVLISAGHLRILDGDTGVVRLDVMLDDRDGGPPNVDDFDGDGFPEIGTAFDTAYVVHDLQAATPACGAWAAALDGLPDSTDPENRGGGNPERSAPELGCTSSADCGDPSQFICAKGGTCVCLHNGWKSVTQDASSRVTGSSVFDFNGDGAAEVVYNDECFFRIYDGTSGRVYQRLDSQSPTRIEYPVVADVDSDGNAEIVFSGSNARSESCTHHDRQTFINGIQVIGEPEDRWISARRIWNQHAYHITNVLESGLVPSVEVPNWLSYGGRSYNTYRSNLPPLGNVAPDLTVAGVQVSSPDVSCGDALSDELRIVARVVNRGDLRVGAQVPVRFASELGATIGVRELGTSLEPGAETFVTLAYTLPDGAALPAKIVVSVDPEDGERECIEGNNSGEVSVMTSERKAELSIELEASDQLCPTRGARVRVTNDSGLAVDDALVRLYAGNPASGATRIGELHTGPIAAHGQTGWLSTSAAVGDRDVLVHAVVDPDDQVLECDDGNNVATLLVPCAFSLF